MNKNNDLKENDNKLSNVPEPNRQEAIAYYNRGVGCCIVGSYEEAIKDYSKAIELDGKFAHAYMVEEMYIIRKERMKKRLKTILRQ